jgi:hypothetical protein
VCHAHPPKFLQRFIDVPDPYPTSTCHIQQLQDTLPVDMPTVLVLMQELFSFNTTEQNVVPSSLVTRQRQNMAAGQSLSTGKHLEPHGL